MKNAVTMFASFFICSFMLFIAIPGFAQLADEMKMEKPTSKLPELSLGADLVSRYIWRGMDYGNSPAIQPNASFSIAGFKISAWGSYGFTPYTSQINDTTTQDMGIYAEADWNISYEFKGFTVMFTDYFVPDGTNPNGNNKYFNFDNKTTLHAFEASLSYSGPDNFPLQLYAGTVFYGDDKDKNANGEPGKGSKNNYSTYFEAGYQFTVKEIGIKPFIGGIPFASSWYGPSAGIVNLGITVTKEITITKDYSLPVFTSVVTNPQSQNIYFVFGLSF
ncbi:MAG: hypothetical protein NTX61_17065 [Bacteroidetes bacterium]|nr:hypothetical protein [Bacteroidota bacterium]